jgi:serine/threonine protein kinase
MDSHGFLSYKDGAMTFPAKMPRIMKRQIIEGDLWYFIDHIKDTLIGYTVGILYESGTYGKIFKAKRLVLAKNSEKTYTIRHGPEEVVVKRAIPETQVAVSDIEIESHISEALLHVLCWTVMQGTTAKWAIPRPYEVYSDYPNGVCESLSFGMSYVEGTILHNYLKEQFDSTKAHYNSRLFREVIGQTAYILYHLQKSLNLNHRDLKANNLIIRPTKKSFSISLDGSILSTMHEITMIDFGFACQGDCSGTMFQAGSWFPFSDTCFKKGRDLAQLIYYIHCFYPLDQFLTKELYEIVRGLMQVKWSGGVLNILDGFTVDGLPSHRAEYHTGIYEFLRRDEVDPISCEPLAIFKLLSW